MAINKVTVNEDCTACGVCEEICPEVFTVQDIAIVNEEADFNEFEEQILEAEEGCPVEAIQHE